MKRLLFITVVLSLFSCSESDKSQLELGINLLEGGKKHEAMQVLNAALESDSLNAMAWVQRGRCKVLLGDNMGAIIDLKKGLSLDSEQPLAYCTLGIAYFNLNQFVNGVVTLDKAIERDSEYAEAYYYRGLSQFRLNKSINNSYNKKYCSDFSRAGELGYEEAYEKIKSYCN